MSGPEILDIVALVQNNPLTRLQSDYGSKIIQKIQERFSSDDQQLFVANFYCYLNYNSKTDFVVNLDRIWKWMGYSRVEECKRPLIKNFKENVDYKIEKVSKIYFPQESGEKNTDHKTEKVSKIYLSADAGEKNESCEEDQENRETRGRQAEYITLTINCFKKLCLKSKTFKADQIHDYYVNLEELMNELVSEQTTELQLKLQIQQEKIQIQQEEFKELNEKALIDAYRNKKVVYLAYTENGINGNIVKFGMTKDISDRIMRHRSIFPDFKLLYVIETIYNRELETLIKQHFKEFIFPKTYKDTKQTELIHLNYKLTIHKVYKQVIELKESLQSGDIIEKLILKNDDLENKLNEIKNTSSSELVVKLLCENEQLSKKLYEIKEQNATNEMDSEDEGNYLYIYHNQVVEDHYSIGITNQDVSKDNNIIFTYHTENAKYIKQIMKTLLKSSINESKTSYIIKYQELKQIFDFCVMMYDEYLINNDTQCVIDFISGYNTHRLTVNSKTRETIPKEIYNNFISNRVQFDANYKIPLVVLSEEFYKWYSDKYKLDNTHIKINGNFSTVFRKEFIRNLEEITGIKMKDINIVTKQLYYHNYSGFSGMSTYSFEEKIKEENSFYSSDIYNKYIDEFIVVTNNERHKVSKKELLDDFKQYTKLNNIYNEKTFGKIYSPKYVNEFMKVIEDKTGLKYESDRTKKDDKGCFVGMDHINFECLVNTSMKTSIKDNKVYKKQIRDEKREASSL